MKKKLSKEQIEEKRNALLAQFQKSGENLENGRTSPTQEFLNEIKEAIASAVGLGVSSTQISRDIKSVYGITISATTVRGYIKNKLGIEDKKRKKNEVSHGAISNSNDVAQKNSENKNSERIKTDINEI